MGEFSCGLIFILRKKLYVKLGRKSINNRDIFLGNFIWKIGENNEIFQFYE